MATFSFHQETIRIVQKYLEDNNWRFQFDENTAAFYFGYDLDGILRSINLILYVEEEGFTLFGILPVGCDTQKEEEMHNVLQILNNANYGLANGCFELGFREGDIRFRLHCSCHSTAPSEATVHKSIGSVVAACKAYGDQIATVLCHGVPDHVRNYKRSLSVQQAVSILESLQECLETLQDQLLQETMYPAIREMEQKYEAFDGIPF